MEFLIKLSLTGVMDEDDTVYYSPRRREPLHKINFYSSDEEEDEHEHEHEEEKDAATADEDEQLLKDVERLKVSEYEEFCQQDLPKHACTYCGIHSAASVVRCNGCQKWFCNGKGSSSASHIIQHLVKSKHKEISPHPDSAVGDAILECYNCGCRNIFILGFITAKADAVVILLCRQPCASGAAGKDSDWDLEKWSPLISDKVLLSWLVRPPSKEEQLRVAKSISTSQINALEDAWRTNPAATLEDLNRPEGPQDDFPPVTLTYQSAYEYRAVFEPLVMAEAEYDRTLKESQRQENVTVRWETGLNMRKVANFYLPNLENVRVVAGDEVVLCLHSNGRQIWTGSGTITRIGLSVSEELAVELHKQSVPSATEGYTVEFAWKPIPYMRMRSALKLLTFDDSAVDQHIFDRILGHPDNPESDREFAASVTLPKKISVPGLPELNHSQAHAIRSVLHRRLSLIQGPPGTGKTVTSATIVYHMAKQAAGPILVTAPSNVAVDQLTEKIHMTGLRVVRLAARWREEVESSISFLSLHEQVRNSQINPELRKLYQLKDELGELSAKDENRFFQLRSKSEQQILKAAEVICATCVGSGDNRLAGIRFRAVLLDEATQACEPEALIPILHGCQQVVLIGDHRQLGPVILNKKAAKAGFNQSLFERLINLGLRPVRLQVQYRMHPCLSEFPSNMFYDGSLQNGVTNGERIRKHIDFPWPNVEAPMFFLGCYGSEELSSSGTSFLNRAEAVQVELIVTRLLRAAILPSQIGVITPYEGQRAHILQYMQTSGSLRKDLYAQIEVASVDAFQGREKDYIILSCVRSNDHQGIGFLTDPRRLNVALTRSKYGMIILGNPKVLSRNHLWNGLLTHYKEKGLLMDGSLANLRPSVVQLSRPPRLQAPVPGFASGQSQSSFENQRQRVPYFSPMNSIISASTLSQTSMNLQFLSLSQSTDGDYYGEYGSQLMSQDEE